MAKYKIVNAMRYYIISLACLFFLSCTTQNIRGTYKWSTSESSEEIQLDSNNRFSYRASYGVTERITSGVWKYVKPDLILTSDSSYTSTYGTVTENIIPNKSDFTLELRGLKCSDPVQNIEVSINGKFTVFSDSLGKVISDVPIRTIHIRSKNVIEFFYSTKKINANHFVICLSLGLSHEIFFFEKLFRVSKKTVFGVYGNKLKKLKDH